MKKVIFHTRYDYRIVKASVILTCFGVQQAWFKQQHPEFELIPKSTLKAYSKKCFKSLARLHANCTTEEEVIRLLNALVATTSVASTDFLNARALLEKTCYLAELQVGSKFKVADTVSAKTSFPSEELTIWVLADEVLEVTKVNKHSVSVIPDGNSTLKLRVPLSTSVIRKG